MNYTGTTHQDSIKVVINTLGESIDRNDNSEYTDEDDSFLKWVKKPDKKEKKTKNDSSRPFYSFDGINDIEDDAFVITPDMDQSIADSTLSSPSLHIINKTRNGCNRDMTPNTTLSTKQILKRSEEAKETTSAEPLEEETLCKQKSREKNQGKISRTSRIKILLILAISLVMVSILIVSIEYVWNEKDDDDVNDEMISFSSLSTESPTSDGSDFWEDLNIDSGDMEVFEILETKGQTIDTKTMSPKSAPTDTDEHVSSSSSILIPLLQPIYGNSPNTLFGYSLSLSQNASTVAIGAPYHDVTLNKDNETTRTVIKNSGQTIIYARSTQASSNSGSSTTWNRTFALVGDSSNDWVGWATSLSPNGESVAINGGLNAPFPWVKTYHHNDKQKHHLNNYNNDYFIPWQPRGSALTVTKDDIATTPPDSFGVSLSFSNDGSRLAVGGRRYARLYQFDSDNNEWIALLSSSSLDVTTDNENSIRHVSLSGDGKIVAVGCPGDDTKYTNAGRVQVWKLSQSGVSWNQQQPSPMGQIFFGNEKNDGLGYALGLSYDGTVLALGTFEANYVKIFHYNEAFEMWEQSNDGKDITSETLATKDHRKNNNNNDQQDHVRDRFGFSLALSQDGNRIVVGSPLYDNYRGRAVVLQRSTAKKSTEAYWEQVGDDIQGDGDNDQEGFAVSISPEGDYVAAAALFAGHDDTPNTGCVRVFKITNI